MARRADRTRDKEVPDPMSTPQSLVPREAAGPGASRETSSRQVRLTVQRTPDVVVRVLSVLHRRSCQVTQAHYISPAHARTGEFLLEIDAPTAHAHCVESWLANLVDVLTVEVGDAA
jgi:acetolactate synthase regulatory subunit